MPLQKWFLDWEASLGIGRLVMHGTPAEIKHKFAMITQGRELVDAPGVETSEGTIDGVPYRMYKPKNHSGTTPLPVGIHAHGGGLMLGDLDLEDNHCKFVVENGPAIVISVDYRLSPEHKWPAPRNDCMTVFRWASKNAGSFGGDNTKMFAMGGSAGGLLSLCMAVQAIRDPNLSIKGLLIYCPITVHPESVPAKYRARYNSMVEGEDMQNTPGIDQESVGIFREAADLDSFKDDGATFPVHAVSELAQFPPTWVFSTGCDPIGADGFVLVEALKDAGRPVKHDHFQDTPHMYFDNVHLPKEETGKFSVKMKEGLEWVMKQM